MEARVVREFASRMLGIFGLYLVFGDGNFPHGEEIVTVEISDKLEAFVKKEGIPFLVIWDWKLGIPSSALGRKDTRFSKEVAEEVGRLAGVGLVMAGDSQ